MTDAMECAYQKANAVKRHLIDFPVSKVVKLITGNFALPLFEERAAKVDADPFDESLSLMDKILRSGLYAQAFRRRDFLTLRKYLANYWCHHAKNFHDWCPDRFERMFLQHDVTVIDALESWLEGKQIDTLYEIGCGGGQVIEYLATRLTSIDRFVGIDLGHDQVRDNTSRCQNPNVTFVAADATDWIPAFAKPRSVFLTNGGVFEYFVQEELESLFSQIAHRCKPAAIGVIETIGSDHNLEKETDSLIYGREMSFSHHYPHLLEKHGFGIVHQSERPGYREDGGGRWLRVLAAME